MELTPQTLHAVEFREARRGGYNTRDVDDFIERIAGSVAHLNERVRDAQGRADAAEARLVDMQHEVEELRRRPQAAAPAPEVSETDETLRRTLVLAQRTADATIKEAKEEANRVLSEAREEAARTRAEAEAEANRLAAEEGRTYVHPYDDPDVIAGQGTCALELLADHPDLDVLVVPVGGGGLLAGMAVAARHLRPDIQLVGVQTERYAAMADHVHHTTSVLGGSTIAEGIAVPRPGRVTSRIIDALVDDVVTVTEEHVEEGMNLLLEIEKVVTEGAGATGIAALVEHGHRFAGKRVGVVLTGGNVDPRLLASVIMRGLIRNGRLTRLHIEVPDVPGSLGTITTVLGEAGANIVEILHQRMFVDLSAKSAEIEVTVETLDKAHVGRAVTAL
ncbi:MAG: pyridoxal-phosphate dependent enzyme, partial [Acidimicrobiales bacterium]|nr:pyridoxal-phosphate dependent enzyme [Acidimicrobiales bacterium]